MKYISLKISDELYEMIETYGIKHGYGKKINKSEICRAALRHLVTGEEV